MTTDQSWLWILHLHTENSTQMTPSPLLPWITAHVSFPVAMSGLEPNELLTVCFSSVPFWTRRNHLAFITNPMTSIFTMITRFNLYLNELTIKTYIGILLYDVIHLNLFELGSFRLVSRRLSLRRHYLFPYYFQSSFRAVSEQSQSSLRAVPEQFQSSFRAVSEQKKNLNLME